MAIKPIEILITAKDKASEVFGGLRATALAAGVAIAGYFTAKLFGGAISGAAELEGQLSEVKAISGATAEEMQALAKAAEDAGATTRYTATEAAEALGNLARAGLSANQAIAALPATLQLAQAGGIELGRASEIVTRSLAGFGLAAEEAGRVADVLAQGANASNTSVDGLAQALSYAAPTAVSMGMSLEQTVAIIGKFADAGIDASRAGTALNSILAQFSNPASAFRSELASAGITTNDFVQALRELEASGPRGQKAILAVGQEAGPALRALLNQGTASLDQLKAKLDAAAGSAAQTAATMEDNLQGAARGLGSAWDTVLNVLGTPVLPVLKDGVNQLAGALRGAVADGTVGKFGNAIAAGFRSALEWGRNFLGAIDVDAIAESMGNAAERVGTWFDSVAAKAKAAGASVQLVWGVMQSGASTVLAIVYKVGEAFAGGITIAQRAVAGLVDVLSKVSFGSVSAAFASMAADIRTSAQATWAVSEAFAAKASESFDSIAEGAELARAGWATLTTEAETATRQQAASKAAIDQVAAGLKDMGDKGTEAGAKVAAGAKAATAELSNLKDQYKAAIEAGDLQKAAEVLQQMRNGFKATADAGKASAEEIAAAFNRAGVQTKQELATAAANARADFELIKDSGQATATAISAAWKRMSDAAVASGDAAAIAFARSAKAMADEAVPQAARVAKAFEDAGIKTKDQLETLAREAAARFETIRFSGQASADGLKQAWRLMAEAAIAANGGVASEVLVAEAAVHGLRIEVDETGKAIVKNMGDAKKAIDDFSGGLRMAQDEAKKLRDLQQLAASGGDLRGKSTADLRKAQEALLKEGGALSSKEYIKLRNELLDREKPDTDSQGFKVDDKGQRIAVGSDIATQLGLANFLKSAGLDEARIAEMVQRFSRPGGDVDLNAITKAFGKMGMAGTTPYSVDNAQSALVREVGRLLYGEGGGRTAQPTRTVNVNLNIGGQTTPVQVASEADAQRLVEVLSRARLSS